MAAAASSSSAAASASVAPAAAHVALAFFDQQPGSFVRLLQNTADQSWLTQGRSQLAAALGLPDADAMARVELSPELLEALPQDQGWLPSADAEQAEVEEFLRWASHEAQAHVRQVVSELPRAVYAGVLPSGADPGTVIFKAELIDLSPKGRVDDIVFAKHRDVWERITRGCAVLRLHTHPGSHAASAASGSSRPILRWAVRANKKFTGHEDEGEVPLDGKLYVVDNGGSPADSVVVSHKCNGSVLHLSARDILLPGGVHTRWVFLGSKKVHVGAVWNLAAPVGAATDWAEKMSLFAGDRYEYVSEMVGFISPHLASPRAPLLLASLARYRLTINAEYVSSVGTGPTDNERIYGMSSSNPREAFGFMLTPNALCPAPGGELGLEVMYGLYLLNRWGFATVSAFKIPIGQLADIKSRVTTLPDVEGAVLYYLNDRGLVQLEKWKSAGYVILRAVREKLKPYIFGSSGARAGAHPGVEQLLARMDGEKPGPGSTAMKVTKVHRSAEEIRSARAGAGAMAAAAVVPASSVAALAAAGSGKGKGKGKKKKKNKGGVSSLVEQADAAAADVIAAADAVESLAVDSASASDEDGAPAAASSDAPSLQLYLEWSHPDIDSLGSALTAAGASKVGGTAVWRAPCPPSEEEEAALRRRVQDAYEAAVLQRPFAQALKHVTERVQARISAIDHVPLSPAERAQWLVDSADFLAWLTAQLVVRKRWEAREVMQMYSKLWSLFREERGQEGQGQAPSSTSRTQEGAASGAAASSQQTN